MLENKQPFGIKNMVLASPIRLRALLAVLSPKELKRGLRRCSLSRTSLGVKYLLQSRTQTVYGKTKKPTLPVMTRKSLRGGFRSRSCE
jgi:hypothetical protein